MNNSIGQKVMFVAFMLKRFEMIISLEYLNEFKNALTMLHIQPQTQ